MSLLVRTRTWCRTCEKIVDRQEGSTSKVPSTCLGHAVTVTLVYDSGLEVRQEVLVKDPPSVQQ